MQADSSGDAIDDQILVTQLYKRLGGLPLGKIPGDNESTLNHV